MTKLALLFSVLAMVGCGDDAPGAPPDAARADAPVGKMDAGIDAPPARFTTLASFNPSMGQVPEGLVVVGGTPYVSLAPRGQVVRVRSAGNVEVFGTLPGTVADSFTLGLAAAANGDIYAAVAASGADPMPAPGIYRFPAAGGAAELYASSTLMTFPNGIEMVDTDLYVTDSASGRIFRITNGIVTLWTQDALLAGDMTACGGSGAPFVIGANGIAHDDNNRYVAVTDFGRIVRIPILPNGTAGPAVVHAESCANLKGADGIAVEASGSLLVARNAQNTVSRVSADGMQVTALHAGPPLDGPASLALDVVQGQQRLLVTNSAFFSGAAGKPSLVSMGL